MMVDQGSVREPSLSVWLQTSRVNSLLISTISVLTGAALAWRDGAATSLVALAWLSAVAAQAGTNLMNVSWNYKAGARAPRAVDPRGSSAPVRGGLLTPEQVRRAAHLCFTVALVSGGMLVWRVDPRLMWLGLPGVLAGYFYASPPIRLAYLGLGVPTVFAFMGPAMVVGTYWLGAHATTPGAWAAACAVGLTAAAVMHVNDVRDFDSDVAVGKRSLARLVGPFGARLLMAAMIVGAYGAILAGVLCHWLPFGALAVGLSVPLAVQMLRIVFLNHDAVRLNDAWLAGVKLHTAFGVLLLLSLVWAAMQRG